MTIPKSEWIPSFSIEARPQQLVGKRVTLASKDGGGWTGTITSLTGHRYTIVDGATIPWRAGQEPETFASVDVYTFDIARAHIDEVDR